MSIKNLTLITMITVLFPLYGTAQTAYTLFNKANAAFEKEDYPAAIDLYKKSLKRNQSMAQHLNIGNAYYHNKQLGLSVLHYLKALAISPNDAEVLANLSIARNAANVPEPQYTLLQKSAHILSVNSWTFIAMICFWGIAMLFVIPRVYNWKNAPIKSLLTTFIAIMAISGLELYVYHTERNVGVVITPDSPLYLAPSDSSPTNIFLPEASLAHIQKKHEDFLFVKTDSKQKGWVKTSDIQTVWH